MDTRRERPHPTGATWSEPRDAPPTTDRRFHDVADLRRGVVETRPVARTLGPTTRAKRLARLGFRVDASVFGAPTYRLTAQTPYQASPEAWLDVFDPFSYNSGPAGSGRIWWRLPRFFETEFMSGVNCNFANPPTGPLVLSLAIEAWPYQDATGVVVVEIGSHRVETPISTAGARIIDIGFVQTNADAFDARIFWRPGLFDFVFNAATVGPGLIVLDPIATDLPIHPG